MTGVPRDQFLLERENARMRKTLEHAGYTDGGGEMWKPPLGKRPAWVDDAPPTLSKIHSDLMHLAAQLVRGEGVPDWSEHKFCSTTPVTERRAILQALRQADESMRSYAVRLKAILDRLSAEMKPGGKLVYGLESRPPGYEWQTYFALFSTRDKAQAAAGNGRPAGLEWRVATYRRVLESEVQAEEFVQFGVLRPDGEVTTYEGCEGEPVYRKVRQSNDRDA
jgi:hypothetical protein